MSFPLLVPGGIVIRIQQGGTHYAEDAPQLLHFVPLDPTVRRGVLPSRLATQSEDVRGGRARFIYLADKNHGLCILEDAQREGT